MWYLMFWGRRAFYFIIVYIEGAFYFDRTSRPGHTRFLILYQLSASLYLVSRCVVQCSHARRHVFRKVSILQIRHKASSVCILAEWRNESTAKTNIQRVTQHEIRLSSVAYNIAQQINKTEKKQTNNETYK